MRQNHARKTSPAAGLRLERLEERDCPSTLDLSGFAAKVNVLALSSDATGYTLQTSGGDSNTYTGIDRVIGNGGSLTGEDVGSTFTVVSLNAGSYDDHQGNSTLAFSTIYSLVGGSRNDAFKITTNASGCVGTIDGGAGTNKLDYTGRSIGVQVRLASNVASATGGVVNVQNVTGTSGNDVLFGNGVASVIDAGAGGNDILVGLSGSNTLASHGSGHCLMIGGTGTSTLVAGTAGGDLMVGESTIYDANLTALNAILTEWKRVDVSYATRLMHIQGTLSGGLNGSYYLNSTTVIHSGVHSTIIGGSNAGLNWYIVAFAADVLTKKSGETVSVI